MLAIESPDPKDRPLLQFFADTHSVEAALAGYELALWCPAEPPLGVLRQESGAVLFGWPSSSKKKNAGRAWTSVDAICEHPELLTGSETVVLARRRLSARVFEILRERLGYVPDIPGQIAGWWYDEDDVLPTSPPPWRPTGLLLPPGEGGLHDGDECLVLVEVNDCAYVLSVRALRTYTFGARLDDGQSLRFVRFEAGRQVWRVTPRPPLEPTQIPDRFSSRIANRFVGGRDETVAPRIRTDAPSVLVRVQREDTER